MTRRGADELTALRLALDDTRHHILGVVDALNDEQLRTAVLPSAWTPLELVRHLTLGDERYWFSSIIGGGDLDWVPTGEKADWQVPADMTPASVIDAYRRQIAASNDALDRIDPDDPPHRRDPLWDTWGVDFANVRVIVLHMIIETATHAGHLDVAAELLDGRQHLVMD